MNSICAAEPCPVILNSTCVFYRGANLIYTGILTNDNLQTVIEKIDNKFRNAAIGYAFNNGIAQAISGGPVQLGGLLIQNTTITSNGFDLTLTETVNAGKFATIGGTSSQFVKGDGSLDSTSYQPSGTYIASLTGDGTAVGPGSAVFTLTNVNTQTGTYGSGSVVPTITVDSKGRITNVVSTNITYPAQTVTVIGDVYGSGSTASLITLTLNNVNSNIYGTNTILKFAVNAKGLVTSAAPITGNDIENLLGYTPVPTTRTLTINGQTYDLSANRSWTIATGGSVSSVSVTNGAGISASVTNPTTTPNITITNTAPDQTVVLNSGAGISTSGTYPNFTITNTSPDQTVSLGTTGSGLSVTGTYPSFTLQNTLPDQTVAISPGTGISVSGTYPNFTITNTSPSSGGTVTGSGTTNYVSKWTPTGTALGDSQIFDNGSNVGIGTITPGGKLTIQTGNSAYPLEIRTSGFGGANRGGFEFDGSGNLELPLQNSTGSENVRLRSSGDTFFNGGNVGVGTTTPGYKLDVTGTFHTTGQNTLGDLVGTGTRMVVASNTGVLSTQAIPTGSSTGFEMNFLLMGA